VSTGDHPPHADDPQGIGRPSGSSGLWARVERLDAPRLAAAIRAATGIGLRIDGPCPGGQVGASYVTWPDGRRGVLTAGPGPLAELRAGPLAVIESLRHAGYPAPAADLAVEVTRAGPEQPAVALVWELLAGGTVGVVTAGLLDQAIALNERQAGALAGRPDIPPVPLFLDRDGPGFCLHGPLRAYSDRSRRLERWIASVAARYPDVLDGDDAVHGDFHPGNFLADSGRVSGVVDWDAAGRGDRRFDLVTLRFVLPAGPVEPGVTERLDRLLDALPADALTPMWAHLSLRMADWSIRHFTPPDVERWLDRAEQRIP
jgi:hypothetical protein